MNRTETEGQLPRELLSSGDFHLLPGVFFVEGAKNGTLCDINSGAVYSINETGCQILRGQKPSGEFWEALGTAGLASKTQLPPEQETHMEAEQFTQLAFAWFELVSDCNEMCVHCYAECLPKSKKERPEIRSEGLRYDDWKRIIASSHELGCGTGQFIGGEPFMYRDNGKDVLDLAVYARGIGYEVIEIFSNGTLITPKRVQRIKDLDLRVAVSLYSIDENVHDAVTQTPGSFRKTMRALELLKATAVSTRVETVVTRVNQDTIDETINWIEQMGFDHKPPDVLRPTGRGENQLLQPDKETFVRMGLMTKPNFYVNRDFFMRNISGHSCLVGKIAITEAGDVLPCIFSREEVVGNVLTQSLKQIVESERLQEIWGSTKDEVLVCQDCEYRYVCFDCRPISQAVNEGRGLYLSAPYPRCTYNPYTGEWGDGVWRLNKEGKPYYAFLSE